MKRPKYAPDNAQIRVQKQSHFTVTPIDSIEHWRKEREQIEAQYHTDKLTRFEKARTSAMAIVSGDKQVELLSAMDKAEIAYVKSRGEAQKPTTITWDMIQAKKSDWDKKNQEIRLYTERYTELPRLPEVPTSPKPSLFERTKRAVARFVRGAFPT